MDTSTHSQCSAPRAFGRAIESAQRPRKLAHVPSLSLARFAFRLALPISVHLQVVATTVPLLRLGTWLSPYSSRSWYQASCICSVDGSVAACGPVSPRRPARSDPGTTALPRTRHRPCAGSGPGAGQKTPGADAAAAAPTRPSASPRPYFCHRFAIAVRCSRDDANLNSSHCYAAMTAQLWDALLNKVSNFVLTSNTFGTRDVVLNKVGQRV